MFSHALARGSSIRSAIAKDGTITRILCVVAVKPYLPGSAEETELAEAIVAYMKNDDSIDRAEID